jgi:hypothetical protein
MFHLFSNAFLNSCTEDPPAAPPAEQKFQGSIFVDVRMIVQDAIWFWSDGSKDLPRAPVMVDLKVYDTSADSLVTIETKQTDAEGFTEFDGLTENTYYVYPRTNDDIDHVRPDSSALNRQNPADTVYAGIAYYRAWYRPYLNYIVSIDTSNQWEHTEYRPILYNAGVRDTFNCTFDTTSVPSWLTLRFNKTVYAPSAPNYAEHWISVAFFRSGIPFEKLPVVFDVPMTHQYGTEIIHFTIQIEEYEHAGKISGFGRLSK